MSILISQISEISNIKTYQKLKIKSIDNTFNIAS